MIINKYISSLNLIVGIYFTIMGYKSYAILYTLCIAMHGSTYINQMGGIMTAVIFDRYEMTEIGIIHLYILSLFVVHHYKKIIEYYETFGIAINNMINKKEIYDKQTQKYITYIGYIYNGSKLMGTYSMMEKINRIKEIIILRKIIEIINDHIELTIYVVYEYIKFLISLVMINKVREMMENIKICMYEIRAEYETTKIYLNKEKSMNKMMDITSMLQTKINPDINKIKRYEYNLDDYDNENYRNAIENLIMGIPESKVTLKKKKR